MSTIKNFSSRLNAISERIRSTESALAAAGCVVEVKFGALSWGRCGDKYRIVHDGIPLIEARVLIRVPAAKDLPGLVKAAEDAMEAFLAGTTS